MSALMRSIPLFLHLTRQACLRLSLIFPDIYLEFKAGHFVVKNTQQFGCVAMDQVLEQNYNKPAEWQRGIIGATIRKDAVVLHDVIKHQKVLRDLCGLVHEDEYTLHHNITTADEVAAGIIVTLKKKKGIPFIITDSRSGPELHSIITKENIDRGIATDLLNCIQK